MTILTGQQSLFLKKVFEGALGKDFFLSGGTALAEYYLKHRLSQDLDFFTINQAVSFDSVKAEILKIIGQEKMAVENQVTSDTFLRLILKTEGEILKVDFVKDVPIHFGELKLIGQIRVDSLENLAVGKLLALFGRADPKDFVDLYFLLEKEKLINFEELITLTKQKDLGLQEIFLAEMIYKVEEIKIYPETIKVFDKQEMVLYFTNLAKNLLRKIKPTD